MNTLDRGGLSIGAGSLKVIALIAMTMDHVGVVFGHSIPFGWQCALFAVGGITFPTLAYLLTEGYRLTRSFRDYALRLFIFALIAFIPFALLMESQLNVLFTLLVGLLVIRLYDTMKNRGLFVAIFVGATLFTLLCDWPVIGVLIIFISHVNRENPVKRVVFPVLVAYAYGAANLIIGLAEGAGISLLPLALFCFVGCTLTIPLLMNYSGKRSRKLPKYFFYAYYPAHLTAIFFIYSYLYGLPASTNFFLGIVGWR
jgi:hypothetical protein